MKNKVLIKLYVPAIDMEYELFIPTNETVKKVVDLLVNSIQELSDDALPIDNRYYLFDPESASIYGNAAIIRDTKITNDKRILLI